ncbi:MAG: type II secretion system protein [Candidatus Omnitrophica bacterium]|nr:type II secretion system protein [Candidatus Omnitrophota bacterium]
MANRRGWTLVETLIASTLAVSLGAAVAYTTITRTRVGAYEQRAQAMLQLLSAGLDDYFWTTTNPHRYPQDFSELATSQVAYALDPFKLDPSKKLVTEGANPYVYQLDPIITGGSALGYTLTASPAPALAGARTFVLTKNAAPAVAPPPGGGSPPPTETKDSCAPNCPPPSDDGGDNGKIDGGLEPPVRTEGF